MGTTALVTVAPRPVLIPALQDPPGKLLPCGPRLHLGRVALLCGGRGWDKGEGQQVHPGSKGLLSWGNPKAEGRGDQGDKGGQQKAEAGRSREGRGGAAPLGAGEAWQEGAITGEGGDVQRHAAPPPSRLPLELGRWVGPCSPRGQRRLLQGSQQLVLAHCCHALGGLVRNESAGTVQGCSGGEAGDPTRQVPCS